jgi:hypothetical protein
MTNNKQQTAVELFAIALYVKGFLRGNGDEIQKLLEEFKGVHKAQIRKAYCDGEHYKDTKLTTDYYNETYGGGEQ